MSASLTMPERMAVLENKVDMFGADLTEVKGDVKILVGYHQSRIVLDEASEKRKASTGVWVRAVVPWMLSGAGIAMGVIGVIFGVKF